MKSVQIQSFFWSVLSRIWTRKNAVFGLDTFHAVRPKRNLSTDEPANCGPYNLKDDKKMSHLLSKLQSQWQVWDILQGVSSVGA